MQKTIPMSATQTAETPIVVSAMYKFVRLEDYEAMREPLLDFLKDQGIRGTILLAREGINGTVAGTREAIDALNTRLRSDSRMADLETKESFYPEIPFLRTKVKLKKEIVTLGVEGVDPTSEVGTYLDPQEWNELISDPDTIVIDTRNDYEVQIGKFKNALDPETKTFRELPEFVAKNRDKLEGKKIAMYCTGGIRCEKSTSYLKAEGFDDIYHLKGGILKYLETVPADKSLWEGACFVFDERVAVDHNLSHAGYDQCYACRRPITEGDKSHPHYQRGVSCHQCYDDQTAEQRASNAERQHQIDLAGSVEGHMGDNVPETIEARRKAKQLEKERMQLVTCGCAGE